MNRRKARPTPRRRPRPHRDHCPMSGKVRYRDAREATDALHALINQAARADQLGGEHTIGVRRKYRCNACGGWHLTSQRSWSGSGDTQSDAASTAAVPGVPESRRSDPLLASLARSLALPRREALGFVA